MSIPNCVPEYYREQEEREKECEERQEKELMDQIQKSREVSKDKYSVYCFDCMFALCSKGKCYCSEGSCVRYNLQI